MEPLPSTFCALDLDGPVRNVAWCDAEPAGGIDGAGWPVRSRVRRLRSWLGEPVAAVDGLRGELQLLSIEPGTLAVVLGRTGRAAPCEIASLVGMDAVIVPRHPHVISPRGIVPAGLLMQYAQRLSPPAALSVERLRDAFLDLFERAADDVQAARYEQDDSVVDRYVELRRAGEGPTALTPVEALADLEWLRSDFAEAFEARWHKPPPDAPLEIVSVHLRCAVEPPDVFPVRLADSDGNAERARLEATTSDAVPCYRRDGLLAGDGGTGPATFRERNLSIGIPAGWSWRVTSMGHLLVRHESFDRA